MKTEVRVNITAESIGLNRLAERLRDLDGQTVNVGQLFDDIAIFRSIAIWVTLAEAGVVSWDEEMRLSIHNPDPDGVQFVVEGDHA